MALPVKTKGMVNHKSDTSTKKALNTKLGDQYRI